MLLLFGLFFYHDHHASVSLAGLIFTNMVCILFMTEAISVITGPGKHQGFTNAMLAARRISMALGFTVILPTATATGHEMVYKTAVQGGVTALCLMVVLALLGDTYVVLQWPYWFAATCLKPYIGKTRANALLPWLRLYLGGTTLIAFFLFVL
jgi:hypothetical protein